MNLNPLSWFRKSSPAQAERTYTLTTSQVRELQIKARYDNSQFTDENARNWWMADILSAKAANNFQVRRTLRMRSRYEVANNPYLFGICDDNANDIIGTGPTLQVTTDDESYNRAYEQAWNEWADEVELVEKLKTQKLANTVDGEGFLVLKTAEELYSSIKLYPCDLEADQFTSVSPMNVNELWLDGVVLHPITQRPVSWRVLRTHPGDFFFPTLNPLEVEQIRAKFVIHSFRKFRPGQIRGIPVFTSSLDLFSELRSYRRAILQKAQVAANLTAVIETEAPADASGKDTPTPWQNIPIDRGTSTTLFGGGKMHQYQTGEPAATYEGFREACLGEACRPLSYPVNLALGTSQKFNFSSAQLDFKNYYHQGRLERKDIERMSLNRIQRAFHEEAIRVPKLLPRRNGEERIPPHEWHWPGFPTLDEKVETAAHIDQLNAGTKTWQQFWGSRGYDWKEVMAQQAEEKKEMDRLKLIFGEPLKKAEKINETTDDASVAEEANAA
jgi:capsid protein